MKMRAERQQRPDIEQKVDRLQNTLKAVAQERRPVTLHGPCPACGQCLLFLRGNTMYCPHCGDGQNF